MATARDGCVVPTEPLSHLLRGFVDEWNRERPSTGGRFAPKNLRTEVAVLGAVEWISQETQIPEPTIQNLLPSKKTGQPRHRHTELRIADAVVQAIGKTQAFHDGTLEVLPNPSASQEARAACCSGSLTGV